MVARIGEGVALVEVSLCDDEVGAGGESFSIWGVHFGFEILEVDGSEGLFHMEISRGAIKANAVPVEYAVGGVGVLLNFVDKEARSDRV